MNQIAASTISWPEAAVFIGMMFAGLILIGIATATWLEFRKSKVAAEQDEDLRQLVRRYEHLAESTLDAQQRVAADVSELRSRTSAVEQILRTVE